MNVGAIITIAASVVAVTAGCVQVLDYLEKKKLARRQHDLSPPVSPELSPRTNPTLPITPSPLSRAAPALPSGTVTFLFTDIEGSTKLWQDHPQQMRDALSRHDALLRAAVLAQGGALLKTTGDGLLAVFAAAPAALAAALDAQRALQAEAWDLPTPLRVRMALHTGACEERDGDFFGPPLNRVARLMAVGHGGQTLLSEVTQGLVRDALSPETTLRDLGRHRLKDLGRPETVFQLVHPGLTPDFPPLRSLDNPELPNNLPQQVTSFIGREKEVGEIKALLGKTRLLTLVGSGGAGKTRLSLQVAADLLDGEGDGVWLVELAALSDPLLVPQAVANVLGVKEQAGQPIRQTLVDALKAKRLLLILDNCEHLVAACASLAAELLQNCLGINILASSREPLNVTGEQTYRVPSLSLPDPKQAQTVESLSQFEAVRLFIERAQAVQTAFAVTNANAPAVAQICWRLDGIPLAIELAAARVRSLSVEEVNVRLDHRFHLLTGGSRNILPRQQTLRALIDWSYDLLTEAEKTLLRRLSVFAGGWTLAAAEAVCAGNPVEGFEVLDLLMGLVDKSLVMYEEQAAGGGDRYRLLETIRQYAGDRLQESGEAEAVQERAASWFLGWAEEAAPKLTGNEQAWWLDRLERDHDNLRASLGWYEQAVSGVEGNLRLAGTLSRFWWVRGYYSEGRQWLGQALARTADGELSAPRTKALDGAGLLALGQGDYATGRALFEESLTIGRQLGHQGDITDALNGLGDVAGLQGDYARARTLFEESLTIRRQLGHQQGIAASLNKLGGVALGQGSFAEARVLYEESLIIRRQLGHQGGIAMSLNNLGSVALYQGDFAEARVLYEESLSIDRQLGHQRGIAMSLNNLGNVARLQGDYAGARALLKESLIIDQQLEDQESITYHLGTLAEVAQGQNQLASAARLWGAAGALRDALGIPLRPADQEDIARWLGSVRAALGEEGFAAAEAEGRAMTWEQAVEYALSDE